MKQEQLPDVPRRRGRPPREDALSGAKRQEKYRNKLKHRGLYRVQAYVPKGVILRLRSVAEERHQTFGDVVRWYLMKCLPVHPIKLRLRGDV